MLTKPHLTVNLSALVRNWQRLKRYHGGGAVAAVVKADAYGLGAVPVARALEGAGCRVFFVATLEEAVALRPAVPEAVIYVFQGMLPGEAGDYAAHQLRPIINTSAQLTHWAQHGHASLPAALHVDTGMTRLGLTPQEAQHPTTQALVARAPVDTLMTHYAAASEAAHPLTYQQRACIDQLHHQWPHLRTSYANSAAHFWPRPYHGDLTRPGCALYGITPADMPEATMEPVVNLSAPILQHREIDADGTLGYGARARVRRGMRTVTVALGYADGILRYGSHRLAGYLGAWRMALLGRVSMDMLCFDASHIPARVAETAQVVTLMDGRQTVNDLARCYDTIGYEVLTRLGPRIRRVYTPDPEPAFEA